MIDNYRFGRMTIQGEIFTSDLVVTNEGVASDWRRKKGHLLQVEDLTTIIQGRGPGDLVVGTGQLGLMKVHGGVKSYLEENGWTFVAEPTDRAMRVYNRLILVKPNVVGVFHITC